MRAISDLGVSKCASNFPNGIEKSENPAEKREPMSRVSTPKSGTRNHQEPPPTQAFNPEKFLHSQGLDRHICEMFQTLLHHRPADPLLFIHEYLKALARAEDEHFQKLQATSSTISTPRVSKKKKDREQTQTVVMAKVKKREAGRENVSDVDIMKLRLEIERLNDDNLSEIGSVSEGEVGRGLGEGMIWVGGEVAWRLDRLRNQGNSHQLHRLRPLHLLSSHPHTHLRRERQTDFTNFYPRHSSPWPEPMERTRRGGGGCKGGESPTATTRKAT